MLFRSFSFNRAVMRLSFSPNCSETSSKCTSRLGTVILRRSDGHASTIETPSLVTTTSRGVVPHLSGDHLLQTRAIRWVHLHFESFLEHSPPVLTLQEGPNPLHKFLGFSPKNHILSLSVRDPNDGREMPSNGKDFISASCVRGVRKMTVHQWQLYVSQCQPNVITALSDVPFSQPPHSQKRTMKGLERSTTWLADLLGSCRTTEAPPNVLVNMVGGLEERARQAFAESLVETVYGEDHQRISPLKSLDEGLTGYVFELVPLRTALAQETKNDRASQDPSSRIVALLNSSLQPLPLAKLRIVHSADSPHEMLRLIRDVGVDLFDAHWAQKAADKGVALDFRFPVPWGHHQEVSLPGAPSRTAGRKLNLGHNLFSTQYTHDHSRLASSFLDAASASVNQGTDAPPVCRCVACSPMPPSNHVVHSLVDGYANLGATAQQPIPPFSRAYIHHLLHTHEMSSHSLLTMHNLTVMDAFFRGIREVLSRQNATEAFAAETDKFTAIYDEELAVLHEAHEDWAKVERERGKGRLSRDTTSL